MNKNENYGSWVPKWILALAYSLTVVFLILAMFFMHSRKFIPNNILRYSLMGCFTLIFLIVLYFTINFTIMRKAFKFNRSQNIASRVIKGIVDRVELKDGETLLDVGCGAGALAISCAQKFPNANVVGVDIWSVSYPFYTQKRCEDNALANNLDNIKFVQGSATKLDFANETFNVVVSNFVYHNIPGNKQEYLLDSLSKLKKGGMFIIHDLFNKAGYKDMEHFVIKLKNMGYQEAKLIPTDDGLFYSKGVARYLLINGSQLLIGIK